MTLEEKLGLGTGGVFVSNYLPLYPGYLTIIRILETCNPQLVCVLGK